MDVNWKPVEDYIEENFLEDDADPDRIATDDERLAFNVLKATFEYRTTTKVRAAKLAEDIKFLIQPYVEGKNCASQGSLIFLWDLILRMVWCLPPGHPWQDSLVQSLRGLGQMGVPPGTKGYRDFAEMWMILSFLWNAGGESYDNILDDKAPSEELVEEFRRWKNLNSFLARLAGNGIIHVPIFAYWEFRYDLESPSVKGTRMDCRVWCASEWMIHCADGLFERMNLKEKPSEDGARAFSTGPLAKHIPVWSMERWEFWKMRFAEIATEAGSLGLDSAMTVRISDALKSMHAAESIDAATDMDIVEGVNAESVDAVKNPNAAQSTNADPK